MNHIAIVIRKLKKNQTAATLGIAGLIVGLICVLYIFLWITDEASYDGFHEKVDRIFVVHAYLNENEAGGKKMTFSGCPPAVAPSLKNDYPEVENACRYVTPLNKSLLSVGENGYMEKVNLSDPSFFDIFSFPFIYGDKGDPNLKNRIVITQTVAEKYFGKINPVGKTIRYGRNDNDLVVSGVIKDIPHNSTISFDAIVPIENLCSTYGENYLSTWYNNGFHTFGLLSDPTGFEKIASTITRRIQKEIPESHNYLRVYKFKDEYLYEQNHIRDIRIFSLIALLVLLAAVLNYVNLNTARSLKQAKETGLRKTVGASRGSVVRLIYSDIAMVCLLAFVTAFVLALAGLPLFNNIIGEKINVGVIFSPIPLAILAAVYLLTALLAGCYPATYLSSFSPHQTLSSNYQTVRNRGFFRNAMISVTFVVSVVLFVSCYVIFKQTQFLQKMDLGFEKEQLMYVNILSKKQIGEGTDLKEELKRSPAVLSTSFVSNLPFEIGNSSEGWEWEGKEPDFKPLVVSWYTDEDMLETFGAKMIEGSFLEKDQKGIVINKTFADMIGWKSFTGKHIKGYRSDYNILGVIDDIHFNSLAEKTKPMAITFTKYAPFIVVKINTVHVAATLDFVRKTFKSVDPSVPFEYAFLNDDYNKMLASETTLNKLLGVFAFFAVLVLCLGLLGTVMFLAEQKTKEIGIRKCMGETVMSISTRFIKPFLMSGIFSIALALPISWCLMDLWLRHYAYRIQLHVWIFLTAGFFALALAVLTVSWQSWKAATRNPVEALRYE